jgi:ABC-type antimicrobial peptide transport system permease subunit
MRKWDVAALYVVESGLIGLLGGLLGIAVGYLVSAYGLNLLSFGVSSTPVAPTGITQAAQAQMASLSSFSFSPTFSLELLVTALAIALLVSVVAGLYPAYRASQLEPAQALRAE